MKKYFKLFFLIASISVLISCSTFKHMEEGLSSLGGQHIDSLINKIGYPDGQNFIAGKKLYIWDSRSLLGYDGNVYDYNCSITVEVDSSERIIGYQYSGNIGGCQGYSKALKN